MHKRSLGLRLPSAQCLIHSWSLALNLLVFIGSMRHFDQAAVFAEACLEYGLIKPSKETSILIWVCTHVHLLVEIIVLHYCQYSKCMTSATIMGGS